MTEYNEGDLVEAVKGTDVRRGLVNTPPSHAHAKLQAKCLHNYEAEGWTLTVIEKAAPKNVLPTEPGLWQLDNGMVVELTKAGFWGSPNKSRSTFVWVNQSSTFTKLEPVATTAAAVIAEVRGIFGGPDALLHKGVDEIAASFGVSS